MADSLITSRTGRLPYSIKIGLVVIGFILFMPIVSAETVKLLENTDICQYRPKLDMDYCYSKYEICDLSLSDVEKSTFLFKDEKSGYVDKLSSIYSKDVSIVDKGTCKELTISAYKSPFKNVDNVLCTATKCYYKYAWWNASFLFKYPINASTSSGQVTLPILINDSNVTINGFTQYIWCNYTVNTTRRVVGYLYFTNESLYRCVDETETFSVMMDVDQGNESDFGEWEDTAIGVYHMNGTDGFDESIYNFDGVKNGNPSGIDAIIGRGIEFDGAGDFYDIGNSYGDFDDLTIMAWVQIASDTNECVVCREVDTTTDGEFMLLYQPASDQFQFGYNDGGGFTMTLGTGASSVVLNKWYLLAVTFDSADANIYLDGDLKNTDNNPSSNLSAGPIDIYIGSRAADALYDLNGILDEVRIYNRTLSDDEIKSIYENTVGTQNFAPLGPVMKFKTDTSLLAINEELEDFIFSDSDFTDTNIINFNTSSPNTTFLILSSMNIEKLTSGGTNVITVRIILDSNETILEEDIRTVSGTDDIGSSGTSPLIFSVSSGEHNITYQFKRTGPGNINISNFDFNLIQFVSSDGNDVRNNLILTDFNHTDNSFTTAFNWTINKTINSSTFILTRNSLTKSGTGSTTATYFFENLETGDTSPFWQRFLSDSSDIGSVSGIYINTSEIGEHNHSIESSQTDAGDVVFVNGSIIDFDLVDSDDLFIPFFQVSNESSNLTNSINFSSGTHLLAESEVLNNVGNSYFIAFFTSFSSTTGQQTPRYFIDSPNLTSGQCFTEKFRTLSDNNDIGNAFAYTICDGLSIDSRYTFRLWVEVETGETLTQLDENLLGFETFNFSITEGQIAPMSSEITNPENGTNVSGSDIITWLPFFDPNDDIVSYNVTLVNLDGTHNTTIGLTNSTSLPVNWNSFQIGEYFLQVEGCDYGGLCDDTNISINIIALPVPDLIPSISFCEDSDIFRTEISTRTITGDNITDVSTITRTACQYGCSNVTLSNWGNAGCIESDFTLSLLLIAVVLIAVFSIRRVI